MLTHQMALFFMDVTKIEKASKNDGKSISDMTLSEMDKYWEMAKNN